MRSLEKSKLRILCTEDHADTRDLIALVLGSAGFEVTCIESPEDAVGLAQAEHFDLYLLDNWMPLSGVGLCEKLREVDDATPILFYSGAAFETDKEKALTSGAQGYLTKPTDSDVLIAKVRQLIDEARLTPDAKSVPPTTLDLKDQN